VSLALNSATAIYLTAYVLVAQRRSMWLSISLASVMWLAAVLVLSPIRWAAWRPLGATVGDFFDKPVDSGGLNLSRPIASAVIAAFIIICLVVLPQRAGQHPIRPVSATS
jgi:uncharacterized membrane-anchored protein